MTTKNWGCYRWPSEGEDAAMVVSNEPSKYTHEDWEAAKKKRDNLSYTIVRYVLSDRIKEAKAVAEEWQSWDEEMDRINDLIPSALPQL
jgi:hypothetical protein